MLTVLGFDLPFYFSEDSGKFVFSNKATKIDQIFIVDWQFTTLSQIDFEDFEDFVKFCVFFRKTRTLYSTIIRFEPTGTNMNQREMFYQSFL